MSIPYNYSYPYPYPILSILECIRIGHLALSHSQALLPPSPPRRRLTHRCCTATTVNTNTNTNTYPQRVVETLVDPLSTCVTVTGERGSGKTEMALQACVYVRERHRFDAIFFADCQAVAPTPMVMAGAGGTVTPYLADPCRLVRRLLWIVEERGRVHGAQGRGGGGARGSKGGGEGCADNRMLVVDASWSMTTVAVACLNRAGCVLASFSNDGLQQDIAIYLDS